MEVVVTTGAVSCAKLQPNHHHQQTNIQFFLQAGYPSCHPTNSVKALKGKYHIPWTCLLRAHLSVFQLCLWPLIAPGYLGGGLPCLSSALWYQYPSDQTRCEANFYRVNHECRCAIYLQADLLVMLLLCNSLLNSIPKWHAWLHSAFAVCVDVKVGL